MKQRISISSIVDTFRRMSRRKDSTDVLGSYTGTPENDERPVQDVDDL